jgi:hypothetical protein
MADITVSAAGVAPLGSTPVAYGTAGAAITAGQVLYADATSSGQLKPALATSTSAASRAIGIALNSAPGVGQPVQYATGGLLNFIGTTFVVGQIYALSTNAGAICPVTDFTGAVTLTDYGCFVGIAITATQLQLGLISSGVLRV